MKSVLLKDILPTELIKDLSLLGQKFYVADKTRLDKKKIEKALFSKAYLVFVDGFLDLGLSEISALCLKVEEKKSESANAGGREYFISFSGSMPKEKLQILFVATKKDIIIDPKINLVVEKNSSLDVFFTVLNLKNERFFLSHSLSLFLQEKAKASLCFSFFDANCYLFNSFKAFLKKDAVLDALFFMEGGALEHGEGRIDLEGENSKVNLQALFLIGGKRESFFNANIDHKAPFSASYCKIKAVLDGFAKLSSNVNVTIEKNALKASSRQICSHFLLSETAICSAKPYLNVFVDDVKASHGATFFNLREEELFYLKARGIDEKEAREILIKGICQEITNLVKVDSLRKMLQKRPFLILR